MTAPSAQPGDAQFRTILELGRVARAKLDPAARFLFASATLAAVVVAGFVARRGTSEMRGISAALIAAVLAAYLARWLLWRRALGRRDRLVRRVVLEADRAAGERVLRALALDEQARTDPSVGSAELASLHLSRVVGRVPQKLVEERSARTAKRHRQAGFLLIFAGLAGFFVAPDRVVEGLDVLAARRGVAPIDMSWLDSLSVVSQPPAYLRAPDRRLDPAAGTFEPQGSTIVVRGEPVRAGRRLVLTDGKKEVPFTEDAALGVVARWTLTSDSELRVAARFGDVLIHDPGPVRIRSAPDLPPAVVLEGAPRSLPLQGIERLELRYGASDDHGLREIAIVLRSGGQEERRVVEKLDGQATVTQGAQAVDQRDPFLRRMFLPVTLTVEAKDTNALGPPSWGKSQAITITPPPVGEQEAARYLALAEARGKVVDLLGWLVETDPKSVTYKEELDRQRGTALEGLRSVAEGTTLPSSGALRLSAGAVAFLRGQAQKLEKPGSGAAARAVTEEVVLAVDSAVRSVGTRDAESVAKRLGDVAEEAAEGFKEARETERRERGRARATTALELLQAGAMNLLVLDELGADLGSVAEGELRRIRRADAAKSLLHAELAARHLAARLRRPTPSFGSAGGGVESGGTGSSNPSNESPSEANQDFDQVADELEGLVREHGALIEQVEHDLESAERAAGTDELKREAAERAAALREAVAELPGSGAPEGSGRGAAALGREHARAMADRLEQLDFSQAVESGKTSRGLLDESKRKGDAPSDVADLTDRGALDRASRAVAESLAWAEQAEQRKRAAAEEQSRERLREAAERERSIERRLGELTKRSERSEASLPEELLEQLDKAGSAMREAGSELGAGRGERGLERQREAQRLLEQSDSGNTRDEGETQREAEGKTSGGKGLAGKADVPRADDRRRAEDFRKRVLEGLGKERGGRLSPAIERYAEGLLQ
ncbi:MAG TPA: DUF4175 domain-containing protein [Polyangiaceae bacterium]